MAIKPDIPTISLINDALAAYAASPEKSGSTRTLKGKLKQTTMQSVFALANGILQEPVLFKDPKELQNSIKVFTHLDASLNSLIRKEEALQKKNPTQSILFKTHKIVDFFRKLFDPLFDAQRKQALAKTRGELSTLKATVAKALNNLINADYLARANRELADENVNPDTIKAGQTKLCHFITTHSLSPDAISNSEKSSLPPIGDDFCKFYHTPGFTNIIEAAKDTYDELKTDIERLKCLDETLSKVSTEFSIFCGKPKHKLQSDDQLELMILMQLALPVDPAIVNAVISLSATETSLHVTLSHAEHAMRYIVQTGKPTT